MGESNTVVRALQCKGIYNSIALNHRYAALSTHKYAHVSSKNLPQMEGVVSS